MDIPVLIPAYNPDKTLIFLVQELIDCNIRDIIIVNDGSKPECNDIFSHLKHFKQCHILEHAINMGKGRALKTGLNYYYLHFQNSQGIVTADADGQHTANDIIKIQAVLEKHPYKLILGSRIFHKGIPLRSLIGNIVTKYIFFIIIGRKIKDTQTGLRGIPRKSILFLLKLDGEGYDYETNMLTSAKSFNLEITEEFINTVYEDKNKSSHFDPIFDSMKIYFVLLRFFLSSIITTLVDFVIFIVAFQITAYLSLSILSARFFASIVNFIINKSIVFRSRANIGSLLIKYYSLILIMGIVSYVFIKTLVVMFSFNVIFSKFVVETILFMINFLMQRDLIFIEKPSDNIRK